MKVEMKFALIIVAVLVLSLKWVAAQKSHMRTSDPLIIETVLVTDMEFISLHKNNSEMENYLTTMFWNVNCRLKTLLGLDISIVIIDIMRLETKEQQPFIEKSRNAEGLTLDLNISINFQEWMYEQHVNKAVVPNDMAILITNSKSITEKGRAPMNGVCRLDDQNKMDLGAVTFYDRGRHTSLGVVTHEIGHSLGAFHDFEKNGTAICTPGYVMAPVIGNTQYFFSPCSIDAITKNVVSNASMCLRTSTGAKPKLDPTFYQVLTMADVCKTRYGPTATIQGNISDCTILKCQFQNETTMQLQNIQDQPVDNVVCLNKDFNVNGRCFRGYCRPDGKILKHVTSGNCLQSLSAFGTTDRAKMIACPASSKEKTPFHLVAIDVKGGKLLSTPYSDVQNNTIAGDKCFYSVIGAEYMWTDICKPTYPYQTFNFVPENGSTFQLVNNVSSRCVKPDTYFVNSGIRLVECTPALPDLQWSVLL